jgi:hypothetical protein
MIDLTKMDETKAAATVSSAEAIDLPGFPVGHSFAFAGSLAVLQLARL